MSERYISKKELSNFNIIYIDDNEEYQTILKNNLEENNSKFNIFSANDYIETTELLKCNNIHGIICAYELRQNSIDMLTKIHNEYDIPSILLIDEYNEEMMNEISRINITDYVDKVTLENNPNLISHRIQTYLDSYLSKKELIKQNEEIKQNKFFTEQAIDSIQDIFYVLDKKGKIKQLNKSGRTFIQKKINKENINTIYDLFYSSERSHIDKLLYETRDNKSIRMNLETIDTDENRLEFEIKSSPLKDNNGNITGLVGIARDVTEQNEYKRNLKHKNKKLDKFAKIISHDIRNPLSIAKGNLDIHVSENGESEFISKTYKSLDRIENILENILEITTKKESELETRFQPVQNVCQKAWENIESDKAELKITTNKMFYMNDKLVHHLFENLFKNAIKHGGEDVIIKVGVMNDGFYVEDNGQGIPEDKRDKIFDPSYTTSGTGLGLTIVEHVCDIHGWNINVAESSTGGARFEITNI